MNYTNCENKKKNLQKNKRKEKVIIKTNIEKT